MAEDSLSSLLAAYSQSQGGQAMFGLTAETPAASAGAAGLEDEELKKYLVSPSTASAGTPQDMMTTGNLAMFPAAPAAAAAAAAPTGSLESALAALGENGRQQLLAILQLANTAGGAAQNGSLPQAVPENHAPSLANGSATSSANLPGSDGKLSGSPGGSTKRAKKAKSEYSSSSASAGSAGSASASSSMKRKSQVLQESHANNGGGTAGTSMSPNMQAAAQATSPAYFANAFSQYSNQGGSHPFGSSSSGPFGQNQGRSVGEGSTPSSGSSKPSPALSAVTSYSASGRGHTTGSYAHSQRQGSTGHTYANPNTVRLGSASAKHTPSNSISSLGQAVPDAAGFKLPDANYYRSPAIAPGTSSSAFYTDLGEDSDLLFTPLLSPALTAASTQPGPSVGPLPESFANLGKDSLALSNSFSATGSHGHGSSSHYSGSTGVSPMNFFSPLTSPALQPQNGSNGSKMASPRSQQTNGAGSGGTATRRGASKNHPKVRPSPILRPTDSSGTTYGGQITNGGTASASGRNSKRNSLSFVQTHSVPPSPMNSVPPSPATYAAPIAPLQRIHEHTAQNALKDSPSPQQFDLSSANSAAAMLAAAIQQQNNQMNLYIQQQQQGQVQGVNQNVLQQAMQGLYSAQYGQQGQGTQHQQQQQQTNFFSPPGDQTQLAAEQQSQEAAAQLAAASIPSPLDLNSFFGMLGVPTPQPEQTSPDSRNQHPYGSGKEPTGSVVQSPEHGQHSDLFTTMNALANGQADQYLPSNYQDSTTGKNFANAAYPDFAQFLAQTASSGMDPSLDQQQLHQQLQQQASLLYPHLANPAFAKLLGTQQIPPSNPDQMVPDTSLAPATGGNAPLTPAAFMNLTQGRYDLLTGLQADQSNRSQPASMPSARPGSSSESRKRDAQGSSSAAGQRSQPPSGRQSASTSPIFAPDQTLAGMDEAQLQQAQKFALPPSPAIIAQSIKEAAAAAIAAKEAKSAAKGRGASRKKAQALAEAAGGSMPNGKEKSEGPAGTRKNSKRAAAQAAENAVQANAKEDATMDTTDRVVPPSNTLFGDPVAMGGGSGEQSPVIAPENRKSSHKIAEQRRRDSLKLCFEELRFILPPINPDEDEDFTGKRPGENNVGGQRGKAHNVDPKHPNKGISKVALLRKSNEYVTKLHERVDKRDYAIQQLREELRTCRAALGQGVLGDNAALDSLSAVDWEDLDADFDAILPTYKITGICAPGSTLTYKPTQASIPEVDEAARNDVEMADQDDEDEEDDDAEEYKAKRTKRTLAGGGVNTRRSVKA